MSVENTAVQLMVLLASILLIILSTEYFVGAGSKGWLSEGMFSWEICSLQARWMYTDWRKPILNLFFSGTGIRTMMLLRIAAALLLVFGLLGPQLLWISIALVTTLLMNLRHLHGRDGADDMTNILLAGLFFYYVSGADSVYRWFGIGFITAQATLAYSVSGWAKLMSAEWRSGESLLGVLRTGFYGCPQFARILAKCGLAPAASWATITWESTFLLIWVVPRPWCYAFLLVGIAFHSSVALAMRLYTFFFAFVACYPGIVLVRSLY